MGRLRAAAGLGPYPDAGARSPPARGFGGEWAPGRRIVVDVRIDADAGRTYGELSYGDEIYGGVMSRPRWRDITEPTFHVEIGDGMAEGGPRVSVSELVIAFVDPVGRWFDIATPRTWRQPQPGTAVGGGGDGPAVPATAPAPIAGEIERIEDVHDGEGVREVSVRGFGRIMDLVVDLPQVKRPAEAATTRFNWYKNAAGWRWDDDPISFPAWGDTWLIADKDPADVQAREKMDHTAQSVGWYMDSTREGRIRVREWPMLPEGEAIEVVDCYGYPGTLVSHSMVFANDESQLLNYVVITNIEVPTEPPGPVKTVVLEDPFSVARFGRRGRAFGFPMTGLAWADGAYPNVWGRRALDRYAYITRQCESFEIDTAVDQGGRPRPRGRHGRRPGRRRPPRRVRRHARMGSSPAAVAGGPRPARAPCSSRPSRRVGGSRLVARPPPVAPIDRSDADPRMDRRPADRGAARHGRRRCGRRGPREVRDPCSRERRPHDRPAERGLSSRRRRGGGGRPVVPAGGGVRPGYVRRVPDAVLPDVVSLVAGPIGGAARCGRGPSGPGDPRGVLRRRPRRARAPSLAVGAGRRADGRCPVDRPRRVRRGTGVVCGAPGSADRPPRRPKGPDVYWGARRWDGDADSPPACGRAQRPGPARRSVGPGPPRHLPCRRRPGVGRGVGVRAGRRERAAGA